MAKKRSLRVVTETTASFVVPENFEDEFDALLDAETDEEFGTLQFKEHNDAQGERAVLKTWTSQDFSNVYVRFRPHLERYARRWLSNPSQIDEVVQDAFLYLMVTLPELDSELGVLRFLKWKLRLLCLDVLRASGRAYINNIDDHSETLVSSEPEVSSALEAADDAAIVRLALSKLTPRHREVLLATMYEEKSIAQVAEQVQLSENATRQLIFRARAAFKAALVGDTDTSGMSAGAILSVAARKAAAEAKKVGVQAMALILLLAIGIGSYFGFNGVATEEPGTNVAIGDGQTDKPVPPVTQPEKPTNPGDDSSTSVEPVATDTVAFVTEETIRPSAAPVLASSAVQAVMNQSAPSQVVVYRASKDESKVSAINVYSVENQTGKVSATFEYSPRTGLNNVVFKINIDGDIYTAYMVNQEIKVESGHLVITGRLTDLIAADNSVAAANALSGAAVVLEFNTGELGQGVQDASLQLIAANK